MISGAVGTCRRLHELMGRTPEGKPGRTKSRAPWDVTDTNCILIQTGWLSTRRSADRQSLHRMQRIETALVCLGPGFLRDLERRNGSVPALAHL